MINKTLSIPKQLHNPDFRFCLLGEKNKVPFEKDWVKNGYKFDDEKLLNHIKNGGNYGVIGGFGNLLIIDVDDLDFIKPYKSKLPQTFTVKTGSGKPHLYYICDDCKSWKIFNDSKETMIDVQGKGKQVVGPGSIHPNGNKYEVVDNHKFSKLEIKKLKFIFADHLQEDDFETLHHETDNVVKEIKEKIKLKDLMKEYKYDLSKNPTMCNLGHKSKSGACFSYDLEKGIWHCFNCDEGGDIFTFIETHKKLKFKEAKNMLIKKAGIEVSAVVNTLNYNLIRDKFGYFFIRMDQDKDGNEKRVELSEFKIIQKQKCIITDIESKSNKNLNRFKFKLRNNDIKYTNNFEDIAGVLVDAKKSNCVMNRPAYFAFDNFIHQLPIKEIKQINVHGFFDSTYYDYPEYSSYFKTSAHEDGMTKDSTQDCPPSEDYRYFINLKYDMKKIEKCINILNNKFARSIKEKQIIKTILCFSIGSVCKLTFKQLGIDLHPLCVITGKKQTGKSTATRICSRYLWNKEELNSEHFKGSKGARLKRLNNDLFPLYIDEMSAFAGWLDNLKTSTTGLGLKFPKGSKDQTMTIFMLFSNLIATANDYNIEDTNFKDKHILIDYPLFEKSATNKDHISYLEKNIVHLGKFIYSELKNIPFENIFIELREKYKSYSYDQRQLDKILYIKVPEQILKKLNIIDDIDIDEKFILNDNIHGYSDLTIIIKQTIVNLIDKWEHRDKDGNVFSIKSIISNEEPIDRNIFIKLEKEGIYIGNPRSFIVISKTFVTNININLKRQGVKINIPTTKDLASKLDIEHEYKIHSVIKNKNNIEKISTKDGLKFNFDDLFN